MEIIHLIKNDSTQCGYNPVGIKKTQKLVETNCWDCIEKKYSEFKFIFKKKIETNDKNISLSINKKRKKVASLNYFYTSNFIPIITDLKVDPNYRNIGLATILMKKIMKEVGPPIQLKPDPYTDSHDEPKGLDIEQLRLFYSKLGFVGYESVKNMIWYPSYDRKEIKIKIFNDGCFYKCNVVDFPEISSKSENYNSCIGNLIINNKDMFSVKIED